MIQRGYSMRDRETKTFFIGVWELDMTAVIVTSKHDHTKMVGQSDSNKYKFKYRILKIYIINYGAYFLILQQLVV